MRRTDALIVGGGPAGAAAAIALARGGRAPHLLERRRDMAGTVCGGFLGWDALEGLHHLGLDPWALGARPIARLRIVRGARRIEAALPHRAAGLSRRCLDEALLTLASEIGVEVERGCAVREVSGDQARLADGRRLTGAPLIVATGKHALRGAPRTGAGRGSVGLRTILPADPALAGTIELHPFRGGYAGLLAVEDGTINLCLSVAPERLAQAGGTPDALLEALRREAPALAERAGEGGAWCSIAGVPYGWRATAPGPWRLGDQAAVIASVVGDGVAVALASGRAAAEAIVRGDDPERFRRAFARRTRRPLAVAELARKGAERPATALLPWLARAPWTLGLLARLTRIGA